jgi:hypothetical protein
MRTRKRISGIIHLQAIIRIQFIIIILLNTFGCKKSTENNTTPKINNFSGIVTIDQFGIPMEVWGIDDGDWSSDSYWTDEEFELIEFDDTISLDNTFIKDTTGWNTGPGIHEIPQNLVIVFPNPVNESLNIEYNGLGLLKLKATIVDKYFNRLFTYVCKDSTSIIQLNTSDTTVFKNGEIYRMYYSLSTTDSTNFYKGHGDILICRESVFQECQKFVP